MKIAFTTKGTHWQSLIDPRFGRADFIAVYDEETDLIDFIDNRMSSAEEHGAGTKTAQLIFDLQPDILITGNGPGGNATAVLDQIKVTIYIGAGEMTIKGAFDAYKTNKLGKFQ